MPKRTDIDSILIIGAGPIVVGQACEFDYAGTQACKALKEEGYRVILVNSNPATIMTDPQMADRTYIEPLTTSILEKVLDNERPDVILPTMGGQTALNLTMALHQESILDKLNIEIIGASPQAIVKAESREAFRQAMTDIGLATVQGHIATSIEEAHTIARRLPYPLIIRPSFTLGGGGGGIAYDEKTFLRIAQRGLRASINNQIIIEESIIGWKEYEMEVVRDKKDNAIIVCSIENIDPMGVHTGDSITVAPALTLTDKEYQWMREASLNILREIGVETGGSNVQFAVNPETGAMVVIEMNPRVSRSSALASKATGFPIAKVAAKLAVGYTLDEIDNDITKATPASFEPTIDYIVTKIPRFAFEKFPSTPPVLGTAMKSVGEVMALGGRFTESLQKALRSLDIGWDGLVCPDPTLSDKEILVALKQPTPQRILWIAEARRRGISQKDIQQACHYDPWFIDQIDRLIHIEKQMAQHDVLASPQTFIDYKKEGFSDQRIAQLSGVTLKAIQAYKARNKLAPHYRRVDSCGGEFVARTPYLYATWQGITADTNSCEAMPSTAKKVIILGSGPNRIGQGVEFDYCCVHAAFALKDMGLESIMVNCNPETVSTDYDTADRLYFEPLTTEDVAALARAESARGTLLGAIVQFGGQTPLALARPLEEHGITILGTPMDSIDLAEDRKRFQSLLHRLGLRQPPNATAQTTAQAVAEAKTLGYPLIIRPSYVLGGRAMEIVYNEKELKRYMESALAISADKPILLDSFLHDAIEIDVDAVCDGRNTFVAAVMEHIEKAGVHSGDSACSLPPHSLDASLIDDIKRQTCQLAEQLQVRGLINVQFAISDGHVYILEVNPRASRTVPFVAKALGIPLAKLATRVMLGEPLKKAMRSLNVADTPSDTPSGTGNRKRQTFSVKEAVFPFRQFPDSDVLLGPEMKSTGEIMGIDTSFARAFAKSQMNADSSLPLKGCACISVQDRDKNATIADICRQLADMGFSITATKKTAEWLTSKGIATKTIKKVREGQPHIVDAITQGKIHLIINTTDKSIDTVRDSFTLRRAAIAHHIPYCTTLAAALATTQAIKALQQKDQPMSVKSLQDYL
ncbi:MAG: carbamoyl-phosphate synthase large subunit [Alphaproteobacteria bacterium GM202ARS2]|nr:carbamoyl-phosphate synthase large subunit [Alphaproteobacteria bacterium GM202ARS2]